MAKWNKGKKIKLPQLRSLLDVVKRNKRKIIKLLQLLLVIVVIGGLGIALRNTLTTKEKIEAQYNQKTDDYNQLSKDYDRLKEDYNELQNLPDVTVSVEIEGKDDVKLPLYSTVEAAKRNVTQLVYDDFWIDDVRMTVSSHNENYIQMIRETTKYNTTTLFSEQNDINDGAYRFENGAVALSVKSYEGENVLISVLCDYKKVYTVYCPVEKEKSK